MKISFSTLGCPGWSWDDMIATSKDLGFDGIEIRGIGNELYVPKAKEFSAGSINETIARLKKLNLEIPCLTSSCYLFRKDDIDFYLNEGMDYINLAQKLGVPYVRVLGDENPEPGLDIDVGYVAKNLKKLADYASDKNVKVLIETNGYFSDSNEIRRLVDSVGSENVGVLWDVHHPFRFKSEPVLKTYETLKKYISFVHIKDSVMEDGKVKYKMMGYGDVPVREALLLLKSAGYPGFVSLEWVKRWCIDLEEPGIVFSHFVNFVKNVIK